MTDEQKKYLLENFGIEELTEMDIKLINYYHRLPLEHQEELLGIARGMDIALKTRNTIS